MDTYDLNLQEDQDITSSSRAYVHPYSVTKDISIKELAETIQKVTGHQGNILWDDSKPDGTPRKLMDVSKMKEIGWQYSTELEDGIQKTYSWFLENIDTIKKTKYR